MLRRRYRALVALLIAAFIVSNVGCSTGAFRQAIAPGASATAHSVTLPSSAARHADVQTASYDDYPATASQLPHAANPDVAFAQYNAPLTSAADYENVSVDVEQVVRGQGYYNGPLKEALINPYVIGAAIIAGIAIPLAVENRRSPVGGP